MENGGNHLLYEKPKILLVDCSDECLAALRTSGWNCTPGTFGRPYKCERSANVSLVTNDSLSLPGYQEQEIVVVDTARTAPGLATEREVIKGIQELWCGSQEALIDPRPFLMAASRRAFDNILQHGGLFIVLLSSHYEVKYFRGTTSDLRYGKANDVDHSNRSFLGALSELYETSMSGSEIRFDTSNSLGRLLASSGLPMTYETALKHENWHTHSEWTPIAWNKYGDELAGVLQLESASGLVLLLPRISDFHVVLPRILSEWATDKLPGLFPEHTAFGWIHRPEYELTEVACLKRKRESTKRDLEKAVREIDDEIERAQEDHAHYHTLLTGTGGRLVDAVIAALREVGFARVIDVDAEQAGQNLADDLREDIRIEDRSPLLVADVRGLTGLPSDEDLTQAEKHALMRTRKLNRTDVQALTIINHERNLPPRERIASPFRDEMVRNAEDTQAGLMTTWDLFRLLRSASELGWEPEHLLGVFYRYGWIQPVPEHYSLAGSVERLWKDAFGFVPTQTVAQGSRLAVETGDTYIEFPAESLQIDGTPVTEAAPGSECGVAYTGSSSEIKKGARVYITTT